MRVLKLCIASGALIGVGFASAPYANGAFIGCLELGFLMGATALFAPERA